MIPIEKAKRGIAAYLDAELMPQLPTKGWESVVVGSAIGIAIKKFEKLIEKYKDNPMLQAFEIFSSDGSIDIDSLRDNFKAQIEKQGFMEIDNIPIVKKLTFRAQDVDKLYDYITKG